jgi:hypothetical protein
MKRKAQHTRMVTDAIVSNRVRLTKVLLWAVHRHQGHPEATGEAGVARRADACSTCLSIRRASERMDARQWPTRAETEVQVEVRSECDAEASLYASSRPTRVW